MVIKKETSSYSWVTDELFQEALDTIVSKMSPHDLMSIPGVDEIVREELNNEVLSVLEEERELNMSALEEE